LHNHLGVRRGGPLQWRTILKGAEDYYRRLDVRLDSWKLVGLTPAELVCLRYLITTGTRRTEFWGQMGFKSLGKHFSGVPAHDFLDRLVINAQNRDRSKRVGGYVGEEGDESSRSSLRVPVHVVINSPGYLPVRRLP
jgi:hypothetical protein